MALRDTEAFLRQVAAAYDPNIDVTPGSPFDNTVIQPVLRRLGPDPFSVDLQTFSLERLKQAYPNLAVSEADNLNDLIVNAVTLLWDPVVREIVRVRKNLSLSDPSTLTTDEADSLGGNFFTPRQTGKFSRGTGRVYFGSPQQITVTQNNFFTALGGLVYFPTSVQSIRSSEMLLNTDATGLYYFDVSLIASDPGSAYDIDPKNLVSVANIPSAVQVTNLARFSGGLDDETPADYAGRLQQSLGEKSLVTLRGTAAKLLEAFPDINRLNVVGAGDPEMQRDVLTGGGLGPVLASGMAGAAVSDAQAGQYTRRFYTNEADFDTLVGAGTNFVLTVFGAIPGAASAVDVPVQAVVDQNTLDLATASMVLGNQGLAWTLRQTSLTLSGIPGGILFPNTPNGQITVPNGVVHVGGMSDSYVRRDGFDEATLSIVGIVADTPLLAGISLSDADNTGGGVSATSLVTLLDYVRVDSDAVWASIDTTLTKAEYEGYVLQIENGPNAGNYRILEYVTPAAGASPTLRLQGALAVSTTLPARWRLFDALDVDLIEPKETRVTGDDLVMTQGRSVVTTAGALNFDEFGVSQGDTLRVFNGPNAGDYTITADPLVPTYASLQIDRKVGFSSSLTNYTIFRSIGPGISLPLIRVESVELLDSSSQPQGSYIPYAKPVDVQSRSFQNTANGVKHDLRNVRVGLVSAQANATTETFSIAGNTLTFLFPTLLVQTVTVLLTPGVVTVSALVDDLCAKVYAATGGVFADIAVQLNNRQFGIRPVGSGFVAVIGGTAMATLFGTTDAHTTADVRTDAGDATAGWWGSLQPSLDTENALDVLQVLDGRDTGFYASPFLLSASLASTVSRALLLGSSIDSVVNGEGVYFAPDAQRHVLLGNRSVGSVRVYFLEPTSFEVSSGDTVFSLDTGAGVANFLPDPTMEYQSIPAQPGGSFPTDGAASNVSGNGQLTSVSQDFLLAGVNLGDKLYLDSVPLGGTVVLADPVVGAAGTEFIYSIGDSPDRTLVFVRDDPSIPPNAVTLAGLVSQINASIGLSVASITSSGQLTFITDQDFTVRAQGTANAVILGNVRGYAGPKAFSASDTSNTSPYYLESGYTVVGVEQHALTVSPAFTSLDPNWGTPVTDQTFRVTRVGVQRVSTTQMASQKAEAGLYYADIELVSEGAGNFWNIDADQQMTVTGYASDGYYLVTEDPNLTFSTAEKPKIVFSRTMLEQGVDDNPTNATQLSGQSIQITYSRSDLVSNVQDFVLSETERVVCSNPLSRHLIPHFVRFDMTYFGGSEESVVLGDLQTYIKNIYPTEGLTASEVQRQATNRGATKVTNPLTLLAAVHYVDRRIYLQRSQDQLGTGRLNAFFADVLNVTRNSTGAAT